MASNELSAAPIVSEYASDPDMLELIEMFVTELPTRIDAILDACQKNDLATVATVAHQIKGAGGGYGYPMLTDVAKALEMGAKAAKDAAAVKEQVDALVAMCKGVQAGFKS